MARVAARRFALYDELALSWVRFLPRWLSVSFLSLSFALGRRIPEERPAALEGTEVKA